MKKNLVCKVFDERPHDFQPQVEVGSCFLEIGGKILLLQRATGKLEEERWGLPAGKIEIDETTKKGAIRELFEETGIEVTDLTLVHFLKTFYIRKSEIDYLFHLFKVELNEIPGVKLSSEHQDYKWVTMQQAQKMDLMGGAVEVLKQYMFEFGKSE